MMSLFHIEDTHNKAKDFKPHHALMSCISHTSCSMASQQNAIDHEHLTKVELQTRIPQIQEHVLLLILASPSPDSPTETSADLLTYA